jgi:hypothetical protein
MTADAETRGAVEAALLGHTDEDEPREAMKAALAAARDAAKGEA